MSADEAMPDIDTDIAIIGMAAHLPGAASVAQYWQNLRAGQSAIRRLSEEELLAAGEDRALMRQPNYVPFAAPLDGFKGFDAEFFGFSPKEAAILDPQHRQFLEVAWEALENAGRRAEPGEGRVAVYAGCGMGSYFYVNLCSNRDLVRDVGLFLLRHTGNDKDFLATRVSHILDLRGPAVNVQTACSTSLVAVHYATQALLGGECDMALAGGVTIELPHGRGYLYKENEILSPDGECHAFDHRAQGTVFGSGAGCVVLKRLADAKRDGDHIWAVVKGTAINNDGAQKAGYLAPSVEGQAECVAEALEVAGVPAESVGYVECHGTGTYLGDPIEVAALSEAFRRKGAGSTGSCRIGSVKTGIGHLDTAAGVASLIKAALALKHGEMPPSLGYEAPNPAIDFDNSPFVVNDRLTVWERGAHPRRAGVNSLGVGGTNAFAVLEEPPEAAVSEPSEWPFELIALSARSKPALDQAGENLATHLRKNKDEALADVANTLLEGRRALPRRRVLVAKSHDEAARLLEAGDPGRVFTHTALDNPDIVFMFPGGGAQYAGMARDLYETEPVFAEWMDRGLAHLATLATDDPRALWLPEKGQEAAANAALKRPSLQLPLIMITEYALAQMLISWGVRPAALIGHSMGENTAACLAGVMGFEDCISLVHRRGQLFDTVPAGGMLSVPLPAEALRKHLGEDIDIAALNAPELTVVSGPDAALDALAERLRGEEVECQRIAIDIAAHSRMLEPILADFRAHLAGMTLHAPQMPVISNRSGQTLSADQAQSPDYWVEHLRNTVRFADGLATLAEKPNRIYLEVGPGKALSSLARMQGAIPAQQVLAALRHPEEDIADDLYHIGLLGRLWALGAGFDRAQLWGEARRRRVVLPAYPFQRSEYFIEPAAPQAEPAAPEPERLADIADWGTRLHWLPRGAQVDIDVETELESAPESWLIFADDDGIATPVIERLRGAGHAVVTVRAGDVFAQEGEDFRIAPELGREPYAQLVQALVAQGRMPTRIAHFWLAGGEGRFRPGSSEFQRNMEQGFYSLFFLGQVLAGEGHTDKLHISIVTSGAESLRGEALPWPEKSAIAGPAGVLPRELPGMSVSMLDIEPPSRRQPAPLALLLEELMARPGNARAALRGGRRHERVLRAQELPAAPGPEMPKGAVWLITGGFGGIGLRLAEELITSSEASVALIARSPIPPRAQWPGLRENPADPRARRVAAIERLEALGGRVLALQADVCNIAEMRAALERVREELGPLHGLIHAAGHIDDAPLAAKTQAGADAVLAPKIHGLRVLDSLLPDGTLAEMVLFSSTSTLTNPAGQADYIAANEYLNAFARARAGGKTRVWAIDWGIWAEVGMAADAMAQRQGRALALPPQPAQMPLLDRAGFDAQGNRRFTARLDDGLWLLDEHRTRDGRAFMPGTGMVEIIAEALREAGKEGPFELRDMLFLRALEIDVPREIELTLTKSDAGFDFALRSEATHHGRRGFVLNAQGAVAFGHAAPARPPAMDPAAIEARCKYEVEASAEGLSVPQEAHLAFGPRWRVLNRRGFGQGEGLAHLSLPAPFRREAGSHVLHPALMDIATGWALELAEGYDVGALWVPVSYERIAVWQALPAEIVSWVRLAPSEPGFARFDVVLAAPDGTICAEIGGFTMKRLDGRLEGAAPVQASEIRLDDDAGGGDGGRLNPAEERLARNLALGIRPDEGAEAFFRARATGLSQVVVSSLSLPALIAEADVPLEVETADGQKFDRPELDGAYVAPRNEIERQLVGFWENLLGVKGIGVEDSFFDLGGHSLIAVRLFAQVKRAFGVEFPISVLFEAPTITACAALIAQRTGGAGADAEGVEKAPRRAGQRFDYLVPMHQGDVGRAAPFFLVAGMFGNVLNLRHLAGLLGQERPFYGLQARGLLGDSAPHERLDEAARDYLAEIRQVQPQGPYFLGGFSGGGLTALEMARALQEAGEKVALLVLLDTPLPHRPGLSRADKALIKLQEFRHKGPRYLAEWLAARRAWEEEKRRMDAEAAAEGGESGFHNRRIEAAFRAALGQVALRPYDGRAALLRPPLDRHWKVTGGRWVSREKEFVSDDNGWSEWMARLSVHEVPGDHDSMVLEPNVRATAAILRGLIHEAEDEAGERAASDEGEAGIRGAA
ncbi:MAG: SDR family NAD(P)-dependent oxidoreductase [Pararhodobacter sp.]|nr:SDR family NAD(P)-dependent oxidoreductase [Pararhodobacter sp.]